MKKTVVLCLILATFVLPLFAFNGYKPASVMNSDDLNRMLFENPSALAKSCNRVNVPSVALSLGNVSSLLENNEGLWEDVHGIKDIGTDELLDLLYVVFENYKGGSFALAKANVSGGFQKNHFAFAVNVNADVNSFADTDYPQLTNIKLQPALNLTFSAGAGIPFVQGKVCSVYGGASVHLINCLECEELGAAKLVEILGHTVTLDTVLQSIKANFAVGAEVNFALSLRFVEDTFGFDCMLYGVPGMYEVYSFDSLNGFLKAESTGHETEKESLEMSVDFVANLLPAALTGGKANLYLKAGLSRIPLMCNEKNLLSCVDAGLYFDLANVLSVSLQSKGGYNSYGLSLNCFDNRIEVLYGWTEAGNALGAVPVDFLTVKVTLGYGK